MGRIFIAAGHGGLELVGSNPSTAASGTGGTTEAQEMMLLRDQVVQELRSRGFQVLSVPDELSLEETLRWINGKAQPEDIALELHANTSPNPSSRGATAYYITNNIDRKAHADLLLLALLRRLPQLPNLGPKPDTSAGTGRLAFCRDTVIPSLLIEVGFLSNPEDRALLQNRRRDIALGIADGLASWSRKISIPENPTAEAVATHTPITISINNQIYGEKGVAINNNAYVPVDLVDRLGIDLAASAPLRRIQYQGVVYLKAIELRELHIAVTWDAGSQTVTLRSILSVSAEQMEKIMSRGQTSEVQMMMFLKTHNADALSQFPDLLKFYIEESNAEGVSYDLAFAQMCLETNYLRFGGDLSINSNNFGHLGSNGTDLASFDSQRLGVRAQIQHLKAYASLEPLVQEAVDPRFRFVTRGVATKVAQLGGRWSADLDYGSKILAILRRLYESADLL
jgi:N-acetylmuramoyl-L-alanine amidase